MDKEKVNSVYFRDEIKESEFIEICERKGLTRLCGKEFYGYNLCQPIQEVRYIKTSNLKSYIERIYNRRCRMLSYVIQ